MGTSKNFLSQKDAAPDSVFFTEQLCHEREDAGSLLRTACQFTNAAPARPDRKEEGRPWLRTGLLISPMLRQLALEPSSGIKRRYNRCGKAERLYNSREAIPFLEVPL